MTGTTVGMLAPDRVGSPSVASFALNNAAPLMVVGAYVTTAWAVTGVIPVSLALLALGGVLAVWVVGYLGMSRHVMNAGSLYTYIAHGVGPRAATAAAAVKLVAYSLLQLGLYGIVGVQAAGLGEQAFGMRWPWWTWALVAWAVVALLGTRGVGVSSKLLAGAMVVELVLVAVVIVVDLAHPAGGHVTWAAFNPSGVDFGTAGVLVAIATTAFVGVESGPVYSEEARQARRTVSVATYLAFALMIVSYVAGSWAMTVAVGAGRVVDTAGKLGPDMLLIPASTHIGGTLLVDCGHTLLLTSIMAGLISYHNAVARCGFALGRDGILPRALARTATRSGAPLTASLAQSATGLAVIVVYALAGWDPLTRLFFWLGTTGALGVLILMCAASVAVLRFFRTDPRGERPTTTIIAPAIAAVLLAGCLLLVLDNYAALLGVSGDHSARWALPAVYLVAAAGGFGYAVVLAGRRPRTLAGIGHGVNVSGSLMLEGVGAR